MKKFIILIALTILCIFAISEAGIVQEMQKQVLARKKVVAPACSTSGLACTAAEEAVVNMGAWGQKWMAWKFVGDGSTICKDVWTFAVNPDSATSGTVLECIYDDNAGSPGSQVGTCSDAINRSTISVSGAALTFSNISATVPNGIAYWKVLKRSAADGYRLGLSCAASGACSGFSSVIKSSDDNGSTWTVEGSRNPRGTMYH